nr:MAG TPA: hypothetical protein [Caudoviricetes sp.]
MRHSARPGALCLQSRSVVFCLYVSQRLQIYLIFLESQ